MHRVVSFFRNVQVHMHVVVTCCKSLRAGAWSPGGLGESREPGMFGTNVLGGKVLHHAMDALMHVSRCTP